MKKSTCSAEIVCKETIIEDYHIEAKELQDKINEYFMSEGSDLSNYAHSYIDGNNKNQTELCLSKSSSESSTKSSSSSNSIDLDTSGYVVLRGQSS